MNSACCFSIIIGYQLVYSIDDYFDQNFDDSKNCESEELMRSLQSDPIKRCADISKGSDALQWEECKQVLSQYLSKSCPTTKIYRVSNLIFKLMMLF